MGSCIIFCAAEFYGLAAPLQPDEYIIAADGGLAHVKQLNIAPQCILGDFDSLGYIPQDSTVFPVEKDDTDAMLAVRHGLAQGYKQFLLYGSLDGPRLDHTVANFQTLQFLADHGATGYLIGIDTIATVIKNESIRFRADAQGVISVFCLGADAKGVTLSGLKYPLNDGTLSAGFPLGVSNHFTDKDAAVCVTDGSLLVIWSRNNALPERDK